MIFNKSTGYSWVPTFIQISRKTCEKMSAEEFRQLEPFMKVKDMHTQKKYPTVDFNNICHYTKFERNGFVCLFCFVFLCCVLVCMCLGFVCLFVC